MFGISVAKAVFRSENRLQKKYFSRKFGLQFPDGYKTGSVDGSYRMGITNTHTQTNSHISIRVKDIGAILSPLCYPYPNIYIYIYFDIQHDNEAISDIPEVATF